MGLDISAYERATLLRNHGEECDDCCDSDAVVHLMAWAYEGHEQSLLGLIHGGFYEVSPWPQITFRAGSYSSYNDWRDNLARRALGVSVETVWANLAAYRDKPFFELLHFSDCEGTIGPKAAANLDSDFAALRGRVKSHALPDAEQEAWFMSRYDAFGAAFEAAARGGLVLLH